VNRTFVISFGREHTYLRWIEAGQPSHHPDDLPFWFPGSVGKGDRYLAFVGGKDQVYVGYGTILTDWKTATRGGWKGVEFVSDEFHRLRVPVSTADVEAATGFRPRQSMEVDPALAGEVWRTVRRLKPRDIESAPEGIASEAKSRHRNAALRQAARTRSNGDCAACGTNFLQLAGGLGLRCLVVHHTKQLKDRDQPEETKLSDLAVVCANCHMMIHANPDRALSVAELRRRLGRR
jgi:hypothetical protein